LSESIENTASCFLELASNQRLGLLFSLSREKSTISKLTKELNATAPEIHRNLQRLQKSSLITKGVDGFFHLTPFGNMVVSQIPSFDFMSKNEKYFKTHNFGQVPLKFIQRVGDLKSAQRVKGFVKVQEQWLSVYKNAKKYIFNILYEAPYTTEIVKTLSEKLNEGVKLKSIFLESAIISKEREKLISQSDFKKNFQKDLVERKMRKDISAIVFLNESEACLSFSTSDGEVDVGEAFYGNNQRFHDWCLDFFTHFWDSSNPFLESKLKE